MGLFGKKKEQAKGCCCGGCDAAAVQQAQGNKAAPGVKILGSGCSKCNALEAAVKAALVQLGWQDTPEHVTDFAQIAAYGVMTTPALVVDGKVVAYGKVLSKDEAMDLLKKSRG